MNLFLPNTLCKGESSSRGEGGKSPLDAGKQQTNQQGESRGGKYAARLQTGYEKDGSPRYKYFSSFEDRDKYLATRSQPKDKESDDPDESLDSKLEAEQSKTKEKQGGKNNPGKSEAANLFVAKKDKKEAEKSPKVKKSLPNSTPLFVWNLD